MAIQYPHGYQELMTLRSDETVRAVQDMQIDMSMRLAPFTVAVAVSVVQVIVAIFWPIRPHLYLSVLEACVLALSTLGGFECWRWTRRGEAAVHRRYIVGMTAVAGLFGLTLASIPVALFIAAAPGERTVIAATCAGLIATGMSLAVTPRVAIAYSGPLVAGSFVALYETGELNCLYLSVLLALYAAFLGFLVLKFSRLVEARAIAQLALRGQQEVTGLLLKEFEEGASDWLWETDRDLALQHASARFEQAAGVGEGELQGKPLLALFAEHAANSAEIEALVKEGKPLHAVEVKFRLGLETRLWSISGKPIVGSGGDLLGYRGVGSDITEKRRSEDRLAYLALNDSLTGLPNRSSILRRLDTLKANFDLGEDFSVFCIDVDGFKSINDSFGHEVGDNLLQAVAKRIARYFAGIAGATPGRMSGDEFVVLLEGSAAANEAMLSAYASQLLNTMSDPLDVNGLRLTVGLSIGVAIASKHGAGDILRRADVALYSVKHSGRGHYLFYEASMDEGKAARAALMSDLGLALGNEEFFLNFQPLVAAEDEAVQGFEALVRWRHPSRGLVSPSEFISLSEETGAIIALGEWILKEACRIASDWPEHLTVAVNISPIQLRHSDLADAVRRALQRSGLSAQRLELEVTESVFLDNGSATQNNLRRLCAMGVKLSLDDFGTGYSSLNYLRSVHFDKVKIDQAFVKDLPQTIDLTIVRAVVDIATARGMRVTAEGVETEEQRDCLVAQGCHQLQGYLFSRPLSSVEASRVAREGLRSVAASGRRERVRRRPQISAVRSVAG